MADRNLRDVAGSPGGLGSFVIGLILACIGGYLLTNQVMITSSYWSFYGTNTFGIRVLPMLIGLAMLFWNERSTLGWLLMVAGGHRGVFGHHSNAPNCGAWGADADWRTRWQTDHAFYRLFTSRRSFNRRLGIH